MRIHALPSLVRLHQHTFEYEKLEHIIDVLHAPHRVTHKSPVPTVKSQESIICLLPSDESQRPKRSVKLWASSWDMSAET